MKTTIPSKPNQDSGEDMNVRVVHGALWRELAEPFERWRRTPWFLRHFYVAMFVGAVVYLGFQVYRWSEYEENAQRRLDRDQLRNKTPAAPEPPMP